MILAMNTPLMQHQQQLLLQIIIIRTPKIKNFHSHIFLILYQSGYFIYFRVIFKMMANFGINPTPNEVLSSHIDSLLWIAYYSN